MVAQCSIEVSRWAEVAALLGVSRLYVVRQSRAGKIPAIKLGKVYRYRVSTIESWLREQEQV